MNIYSIIILSVCLLVIASLLIKIIRIEDCVDKMFRDEYKNNLDLMTQGMILKLHILSNANVFFLIEAFL